MVSGIDKALVLAGHVVTVIFNKHIILSTVTFEDRSQLASNLAFSVGTIRTKQIPEEMGRPPFRNLSKLDRTMVQAPAGRYATFKLPGHRIATWSSPVASSDGNRK